MFSVTARSASSYSSSARVRWPGHGCSIPSWSLSLKSGPPRRSRGGHPCTATVVAGGPSATVSPSLCDLCVATSVSDSTSRLWLRPPLHIVRQSPSGCHHFRNLRVHGCVWTSDLMSSCLQFSIGESPICVGVRCCRPSVLILTHVFSSCLTGSWRVWFVCRLFFASGSVFPVSLFFQFFLFVLFFMCVLVLNYFSLTLSLSIFFSFRFLFLISRISDQAGVCGSILCTSAKASTGPLPPSPAQLWRTHPRSSESLPFSRLVPHPCLLLVTASAALVNVPFEVRALILLFAFSPVSLEDLRASTLQTRLKNNHEDFSLW